MARLGYGLLSAEAFVGFRSGLDRGVWGAIPSASKRDGDVRLDQLPVREYWKALLVAGIDGVVAAHGAANDASDAYNEWAQAERRLVFKLQLLTVDRDAEVADAARRAQDYFCPGGTTGMVRRDAEGQVDFARTQLEVAARPDVAKLVKKLGLAEELRDIREATDALAAAIGRDRDGEYVPRAKRILKATAACAAVFNHVHEGIEAVMARTGDAAQREEVARLLAPMERLLERRPAQETAAEDDDADAEGDAEDPTGTDD